MGTSRIEIPFGHNNGTFAKVEGDLLLKHSNDIPIEDGFVNPETRVYQYGCKLKKGKWQKKMDY